MTAGADVLRSNRSLSPIALWRAIRYHGSFGSCGPFRLCLHITPSSRRQLLCLLGSSG